MGACLSTHHVGVGQARVAHVVPDARNEERKDVHRAQQLAHAALFNGPVPSPLAPSFAEVGVVVVLAQEVERRCEAHANEERVARLGHVGGVVEVVVAVAGVVCRTKGQEQVFEAACAMSGEVGIRSAGTRAVERRRESGAPRSKSTPSMLRTLSKMRPTQARSSSGE